MKKYISPVISGYLSAYGLCVVYRAPLLKENFEEGVDYITASVYELLGDYSFSFFLIWLLCTAVFFLFSKNGYSLKKLIASDGKKSILPMILGILFSFSFILGRYFTSVGTGGLFASLINSIKTILSMFGLFLLFFPALYYLKGLYEKAVFTDSRVSFFSKHAFPKGFGILFIFYLPFLILSFPGNLCYDGIGQIEQVLYGSFSTHHPLIHTLWAGGMALLGKNLFSSLEIGIFLYVLMQTLLLLAAFAASIAFLAKQNVRPAALWCLLVLYCITPIYTNLATTAVKDVPFTAFVLLYYIFYAFLLRNPGQIRRIPVHVSFVILQIGVIVMRNNGLALVALSGIAASLYLVIRGKKDAGKNKSQFKIGNLLLSFGAFFAESILIGECILLIVSFSLQAQKGSRAEIFSLPFQQIAYTVKYSDKPLTQREYAAIETVLDQPEILAQNYNPDIADPVKAFYKKDSTLKENIAFFVSFTGLGLKHPILYTKAFLIHTYGWYSPAVSNVIRYETEWDPAGKSEIFRGAHKCMIFLYRFAGRTVLPGILENIGLAVWILAFLTWVFLRRKKNVILTVPLWIHFLVCLASPCFIQHPRYGLPILALLPFLCIYATIGAGEDKTTVQKG